MTKLYFHAATSGDTGSLPTTVQSALGTPSVSSDASTVNRSMDSSIGVAQASKALTCLASVSTQKLYFTRFCSPPLNMTSLASDTWNFAFAAKEATTNINFPCSGASQVVNVTAYIWRPSDGTKIATILDGNSTANFNEPASATLEKSVFGTFAGAGVSFAANDIICIEIYFSCAVSQASAQVATFYYDGTTETNVNGTTVSNHASYIETPGQTITFQSGGTLFTVSITDSVGSVTEAVKKKSILPIAQSISVSESVKKKAIRAISQTTLSITDLLKKIIIHNIVDESAHHPDETVFKKALLRVTEGNVSVTEAITKAKVRLIMDTAITTSDSVQKKPIPLISDNITISPDIVKKKAILKAVIDTTSVSEVIRKIGILHIIQASITVSDNLIRKQIRNILQNITVSEGIKKKAALKIAQVTAVSENLTRGNFITRSIIEPIISVSEIVTIVAKLKSGGRRLLGIRATVHSRGKVRKRYTLFHRGGGKQQDI